MSRSAYSAQPSVFAEIEPTEVWKRDSSPDRWAHVLSCR